MDKNSLNCNLSIGQRIRNIRYDLGYKKEMFAELLEVSVSTLENVEIGRTKVPNVMLSNLYYEFGISSDDILYGTQKSNTMKGRIIYMIVNLSMERIRFLYKVISEYIHYHK